MVWLAAKLQRKFTDGGTYAAARRKNCHKIAFRVWQPRKQIKIILQLPLFFAFHFTL